MIRNLNATGKKNETVRLSLLDGYGRIHKKSGLNWGQRKGRDPNQAYIPIPISIHKAHPCFFPSKGTTFVIRTDDGQVFTAVTAQDNSKAIETPYDNGFLGLYFRRRIGVPSGEFVTKEDLEAYGRTDVEITKIGDREFKLDFSVKSKRASNS